MRIALIERTDDKTKNEGKKKRTNCKSIATTEEERRAPGEKVNTAEIEIIQQADKNCFGCSSFREDVSQVMWRVRLE